MSKKVTLFCRSCEECQRTAPRQQYDSGLYQPVGGLFDTFSMDYAGSFPGKDAGNKHILVGVEPLSGWLIVNSTKRETANVAAELIQIDLLEHIEALRNVETDNRPAIVAVAFC